MPSGRIAVNEDEPRLRCASRIRWYAETVVRRVVPRLHALSMPVGSIDDEILRQVVAAHLDAVARAVEIDDLTPLHDYLETAIARWRLYEVPIDHAMRGLFLVGDTLEEVLARDDDPMLLALLGHWIRETAAIFPSLIFDARSADLRDEMAIQREAKERLLSLQRVSAAVVSDLDLDRMLALIAQEARRLIGASAAVIRLADDGGETLRLIASAGTGDAFLLRDPMPVVGSLAGDCFRTGQPVMTTDLLADPRRTPEVHGASQLRSILTVPLRVRDRVIGILLVGDHAAGSFGEPDLQLLSLFADQAAGAIESGRLYQQAQEQIVELAVLQRISSVISSSLDLDEVFHAIYDEIRGVMPVEAFLIVLTRSDGGTDIEFIMDGDERYSPLRDFPVSPVLQTVLDERHPVVIGDVLHAVPPMHTVGHPDTRVRSVIAAPLLKGSQIVGLISAQSYQPQRYRESDARLLMTIANHAVVAIDHARLYRQAQSVAVVEERARLAREIHDTLAQGLIGITLYLERLEMMLLDQQDEPRALVGRALELARANLEEARRSVHDLRAAPLEGRTLEDALRHLAAEVRRETGIDVVVSTPPSLPVLAARVETALFRMTQEATTNGRKHARCGRIQIALSLAGEALSLCVTDDGRGFDPELAGREPHRFGLGTMRERITQVGGEFSIHSRLGEGTTVQAVIPLGRAIYAESNPD